MAINQLSFIAENYITEEDYEGFIINYLTYLISHEHTHAVLCRDIGEYASRKLDNVSRRVI